MPFIYILWSWNMIIIKGDLYQGKLYWRKLQAEFLRYYVNEKVRMQ